MPSDVLRAQRESNGYLSLFQEAYRRDPNLFAEVMATPGVASNLNTNYASMGPVAWASAVSGERQHGVPRYYLPLRQVSSPDKIRNLMRLIRDFRDEQGISSFAEAAIYYGLNQVASSLRVNFTRHRIPLRIDDKSLAIEVTKADRGLKGPPLIGVHGYRERAAVNYAQLSEVYAVHRGPVYWIHLPGHGSSSEIDGLPVYATDKKQYTMAVGAAADWISKQEKSQNISVFAHSLGGAVFLNALIDGELDKVLDRISMLILTAPMMALKGMGGVLYDQTRGVAGIANSAASAALNLLTSQKRVVKYAGDPRKTMRSIDPYGVERVLFQRIMGVSSVWDASRSPWLHVAYSLMDGLQDDERRQILANKLEGKPTRIIISRADPVVDGDKVIELIEGLASSDLHVDEISAPVHTIFDSMEGMPLVAGYLGLMNLPLVSF